MRRSLLVEAVVEELDGDGILQGDSKGEAFANCVEACPFCPDYREDELELMMLSSTFVGTHSDSYGDGEYFE